MKIFSLIPARSGSRGISKKNIKLLGAHPLIAYSIAASLLSKKINRTVVSTDSEEIAVIAKKYGAEVPFLRPAEFAQDSSTDLDVFAHAISWLEKNEGELPDLFVYLRPTTPFRDPTVIDNALERILANPEATSLRSAHQISQPPQKMFQIGTAGFWSGFFPDNPRSEYYNLPRQAFPNAYCPNGYVDILKSDFIKNNPGKLFGPKMLSFTTDFVSDIDHLEDFEYVEHVLIKRANDPICRYLTLKFPMD